MPGTSAELLCKCCVDGITRYDPANQLNYGQFTAGRTTYTYDLTGNQRIEQPPTGNRTSTTKFVWDPVIDAYIQELNGSNVLVATYTSEPQQYGGVLSQRRGSTSSFLHADALGTTRLLTSTAGATTDTYLLDAWGVPVASTGTTVNPLKWVGRYGYYTDNATGLLYVRARMYQPTTARWVSVDLAYGMVFVDQYRYSMNMPLLLPDPNGNCPCCCCVDHIDYTTPKFGEYLPAGQERSGNAAAPFGRWPLQFQVVATMELTAGPGSPTCEMEWFECSDKGANRGQIGGQWSKFDMTTDGITSGVYGPDTPRCPGWFQQYIGDAPTLDEKLEAVTRINFFVRARSSDGCDCSANEVSVAFNLVVKTVKIDFNNPGAPPKFEPNPPVLKRGLDPTILGCGVPPGVV